MISKSHNSPINEATLVPGTTIKREVGVCGIANIPNQIHFLASRQPLTFNILLTGESSLGKRTFINQILGAKVFPPANPETLEAEFTANNAIGIRVRESTVIDEGIKATIRLIDTPLLGYSVTKADGYRALGDYVEDQLIKHRKPEFSIIQPPQIRADPRVHLCLFFINAHQRQLSQLDLLALQRLTRLTNVMVVISQADMLTSEEAESLRTRIRRQLRDAQVKTFSSQEIPFSKTSEEDDDKGGDVYLISNRNLQNNEFAYLSTHLLRAFLPYLLDNTRSL